MIEKEVSTYYVKIFIAGPIEIAKQILREECFAEGLCVTIEPTLYIYTGGEEVGYVVGLVNYPRFPKTEVEIYNRAYKILSTLVEKTFQKSAMLVTPNTTKFISLKDEND